MDGSNPAIASFVRIYIAYDDDALAALANRGLVRRAHKDLEKLQPKLISASESALELELEGCRVKLAPAAAQSTCSCASGICRHILTAILHVKSISVAEAPPPTSADPASPPPPATPPDADLLQLDDQTIQRWAGKAAWREGMKLASRGGEFELGAAVIIRLPSLNITCRWVSGGGLNAMLCSCHAPGPCNHKVAAILTYQAHRGARSVETQAATLDQSAGAPRTRSEVRNSIASLLRGIVTLGLTQLSPATEQRLRTLAVSAHGVDLPRLQRLFSALADEVRLTLARDSQAASGNFLSTAARVFALCIALDKPTPQLVGQHRSVYDKLAGDIELVGVGARQWRTRSGYTGLTVYFWDVRSSTWNTWSESRPITQPDFDPANRYEQDGPWLGCSSPRRASRGRWRLTGTWRNTTGRLSGRSSTRAISIGDTDIAAVPSVVRWSDLAAQAKLAFAGGFTDRKEGDDLALLSPAGWTPVGFDDIRQEATCAAQDAEGQWLPLRLPHTPQTARAITVFQSIDITTVRTVLCQIRLSTDGLFVEPITLFLPDKTINLTLDSGSAPAKKPPAQKAAVEAVEEEADDDDLDDQPLDASPSNPIQTFLASIQVELAGLIEAGLASHPKTDALAQASAECRSIGLNLCADALAALVHRCEESRKSMDASATAAADCLLRAAYLVNTAADQAILCSALGPQP